MAITTNYLPNTIIKGDKNLQFYMATYGKIKYQGFVKRPLGIEDYLLLYTIKGEGICFVNGKEYILREDSLLYIPPNSHHIYQANGDTWETMYITFNGNGTKGLESFGSRILNHISDKLNFIEYYDTLKYYNKYPALHKKMSIELYALVLDLTELLEGKLLGEKSDLAKDSRLSMAITYLSENYDNDLTYLLEKMGMSKEHFCRVFKKYTGYRPIEYSNYTRIQKAKVLLKETDFSVGKVADETGFANHSYFASLFKRFVGVTPSEYRNNGEWKK